MLRFKQFIEEISQNKDSIALLKKKRKKKKIPGGNLKGLGTDLPDSGIGGTRSVGFEVG